MTYYVIGLMSGSSLDGLDMVHTSISYVSGKWEFEINHSACIPFPEELYNSLKKANSLSIPEFSVLNTEFGKFMAEEINKFKEEHHLLHKIHFIASHGHTVYHHPEKNTSVQIGDGATIAALTGYPTISDLRNMDVALGGQGAPIVPVADRLFFKSYEYCLNLGGIANITINKENLLAFDICPANQLLDKLASDRNLPFDENGNLASRGNVNFELLDQINKLPYYAKPAPKSLHNDFSKEILILLKQETTENALATAVTHICQQITNGLKPYSSHSFEKILVTGGGAFNSYLINELRNHISAADLNIEIVVPNEELIQYKEALAMALIGVLRWREEENVFSSVTGASRNSIGGALWLGA